MKLEVGMYVRTKNGYIAKCTYIDEELESIYGFDSAIRRSFGDEYDFIYCKEQEKYIIKTSHNIKELLQVGDIITYEFPTGLGMLKYENVTISEYLLDVLKSSDEYTILSIVTKEQFESMSYHI